MLWIICVIFPFVPNVQASSSQYTNLTLLSFKHYSVSVTWPQAQSDCREKHTDLATIRNEKEWKLFKGGQGWIGLYRRSDTDPWKWSRGDERATYLNWASNDYPKDGEYCAFQVHTDDKKWASHGCHEGHSYMCYDNALVLIKKNKTWEEALEHCRSLSEVNSYDLITLITSDDHDYARERAQLATTAEVWTGLRYLGHEWFWVGGERVQYKDVPRCPAVRCGVLEKNKNTAYGIRDCRQRRNFLCYKKPKNS